MLGVWTQTCRFALYHWKAQTDYIVTYLIVLPHVSALFMALLHWDRWSYFRDSKISIWNKMDEKSSEKMLCVYSRKKKISSFRFIPFPVMLLRFSPPLKTSGRLWLTQQHPDGGWRRLHDWKLTCVIKWCHSEPWQLAIDGYELKEQDRIL